MSSISLNLQNTIYRHEAIISSEVDDGIVMMDIEKGQYYSLNSIGSEIWLLTEKPINVQQLCDKLIVNYHVPVEKCQQELLTYLVRLLELGILKKQKISDID